MEGKSGMSKIRKRGCSSSSSSSLVRKYRFKRAIFVGKRGGSTTPVPTWKTTVKTPKTEKHIDSITTPSKMSVSARKLAATLWEINKFPSPPPKFNKQRVFSATLPPPPPLPHLSDLSYSPISESMEQRRGGRVRRRRSSVAASQMIQVEALDPLNNANLIEMEACRGKTQIGSKTRLKDVSNSLTASKELVKVLNRIWGAQEQHMSSKSLFSALKSELDRSHLQVDQLIKEQRANHNEVEYLMKLFAEEKAAWRRKERDRIRDAVACISEELEVEKKLRRQTERLNKKLGKELAETKASLAEATKELDSEKRAKEILEQVCDELARGIGEDRAEVEELKRESVKVRQEVEKEREMLQLADVLREERVQMKLSEAKYHFEEKNAAVERLKNELKAYLRTKEGAENVEMSPSMERIKDLEAYLKKIQYITVHENAEKAEKEEVQEGDDSGDSDLHSIELNMDSISQNYKWSYVQDDHRRVSIDKGIHWDGIGTSRSQEQSSDFDKDRFEEIILQMQNQDQEDEIKRYRSIKSLRDHILSGSKISLLQEFSQENDGDGFKRRSVELRSSISS